MSTPRATFVAAAVASYAAMFPDRIVKDHLVLDPLTDMNDAQLRRGVVSFVAERMAGWAEYTGREGEYGTLQFSIVVWARPDEDNPTAEHVTRMEEVLEGEVLAWMQAAKTGPLLDAVYPKEIAYSGGLDTPYAWIVMRAEALYV